MIKIKELLVKEILRGKENKAFNVYLKNSFRYSGLIVKCELDSIIIDDVRNGHVLIDLDEISSMRGCSK